MRILLTIISAYILGSIPNGYIVTNVIKGIDVRKFGSGNVGATNVARVMGFKYGLIVALLDIFKGYLAVMLAQFILPEVENSYLFFLVGLAAIIGHNWSIFLNFTGGKGVATTFGVLLRLLPVSIIIFAVIWLSLVFLTRYVSIASLLGAISLPISTYIVYRDLYILMFAILLALFIIVSHHANIKRLIKGNENRMTWPPGQKGGN